MNPFDLKYNPDYFCDRESELKTLSDNLINGLNTLIHSPRRLGKTALIQHLFHNLEKEKTYDTLYVDLFAGQNMQYLIKALSERILEKYYSKNLVTGISKLLKGISPSLSFTPDGLPQIGLNLKESELEFTLNQLFNYLEEKKTKVIIAFDEFQEVANYPERAEAILRTYIQQLRNVSFIFSGSSSHILQEMFLSAQRPFYQSTEVLVLDKINRSVYHSFISETFQNNKKEITKDSVDFILEFTENYTYYTHVICNMLFYHTKKKLTADETKTYIYEYLESRKADYYSFLSLLPDNQSRLMIAIAKEGLVTQPTAFDFLIKYNLPSSSSTLQALNALLSKEILYRKAEGVVIYDVFFRRFLERYF